MSRFSAILYRLAQLGVLAVAAGFWFHTSKLEADWLGKYSFEYLIAGALFSGGVVVLGWGLLWFLFRPQRVKLRRGYVEVPRIYRLGLLTLVGLAVLVPTEWMLRNQRAAVAAKNAGAMHSFLQLIPKAGDESLGINTWGYRGAQIERTKPEGVYRIFFLGGSTVFCAEASSLEATHCEVLRRKLSEARPGAKIEVQNAGMQWHTSEHSLLKFLCDVQDFQPDLVIVMHGINDLSRSFCPPEYATRPFREDYGNYYGPLGNKLLRHQRSEPVINLVTIDALGNALGKYWYSDFRLHEVSEAPFSDWKSLAPFRRNLREIARSVTDKKMGFVLCTQPSLYRADLNEGQIANLKMREHVLHDDEVRPDLPSIIAGMEAFNKVSREVAGEYHVPLIDLDAAVPKQSQYFEDDVHYSDKGNLVVGEAVAKAIVAAWDAGELKDPGKPAAPATP